jgi:hypothetical protein
LSVDDGQAALFSLRGVDQHPFHDAFLLLSAWLWRRKMPAR